MAAVGNSALNTPLLQEQSQTNLLATCGSACGECSVCVATVAEGCLKGATCTTCVGGLISLGITQACDAACGLGTLISCAVGGVLGCFGKVASQQQE